MPQPKDKVNSLNRQLPSPENKEKYQNYNQGANANIHMTSF
jgi:hypothetical protein